MSGPDLHVFTLKFLALKKVFFSCFLGQKNFFYKKGIMQLFSADAIVFSKKLKKNFFDPQNMKKPPSKVAHNRPRPFYFTVQPRPQPTAQN